jgi:tRNA-binding protein
MISDQKIEITDLEQFQRVEIRAGTILEARAFPEAKKPAYQLVVDFGPSIGIKQSSAQITAHYKPEHLIGLQVLAVVNFAPRKIAQFSSEVLVLGLSDAHGDIVLIKPDQKVPNGSRLH